MSKISDKVYHMLSAQAYKDNNEIIEIETEFDIRTYKEIKQKDLVLDDEHTGFDAKVYQNKSDQKEIIIAFRGTQGDDLLGDGAPDLSTDIHYILKKGKDPNESVKMPPRNGTVGINKYEFNEETKRWDVKNQFRQADELVTEVKKKFPNTKVSLTGHSLGAALATYAAALHDLDSVSFSTPPVIHLLPDELQEQVKKGKFDNKIINYIHPKDMIGAGPLIEYERWIGSTYYIGEAYKVANAQDMNNIFTRIKETRAYHEMNNFMFDKFGNINNPVILDLVNQTYLHYSPRFVAPGAGTIEVTPEDLRQTSKEIKQVLTQVTDILDDSYRAMTRLNNIKDYAHLQEQLMNEVRTFKNWFEDRVLETAHDLEEAATLFEEADQLKK